MMLKRMEFVEAGRALGFGPARIMAVHILPNMMSDVVVMGSLWMAAAIRTEAALSFIGLGVPAPAASWGGMIAKGWTTSWTPGGSPSFQASPSC